MSSDARRARAVFYFAIGWGSVLLFLIQPAIAKSILPVFGGSAGVWVTAMMFFQSALLAGYLYAYLSTRFLSPGAQSMCHVALLALSMLSLPVLPSLHVASTDPTIAILLVLLRSVGPPYMLLAATSPLLQSWLAASDAGRFPYRLFALSNAGSVLALLAYPVLIEPFMTASSQLKCWSVAYGLFAASASAAALLYRRAKHIREEDTEGSGERRTLLWIALAACPSLLWLAVANHLSQEVAPAPFLWVLPLSLYLLSFILCFEGRNWYQPALFRWLLPVAWIGAGYSIARPAGLVQEVGTFSFALFIWCMFCHGELARTKPETRRDLTFFYLMLALGGALGGIFVGVVAPNVFSTWLELPIGITASVMLALPLLYRLTSKARLVRLAVLAAAAFAVAVRFQEGAGAVHLRNFYGALQVDDFGTFRALYNGRTLHGVEFTAADSGRLPTTYYGPESGAGKVLSADGTNRRVALVGLGAGTLAAYARKGDTFRFYEINPAVIRIARQYFHFLDTSPAQTDVIEGDGRLALALEPAGSFDAIILDAFSDDSIPVHLITKEAFALYFRLLRANGVIAIHLTNRYLDLEPVVRALAESFGRSATAVHSPAEPRRQILAADWVVISGHAQATAASTRLWTDDYSNLLYLLK